MKTQITEQLIAKAYFMAYLIIQCLSFVASFSDEYTRSREVKINQGRYGNITISGIITFFLFVLSCYLK